MASGNKSTGTSLVPLEEETRQALFERDPFFSDQINRSIACHATFQGCDRSAAEGFASCSCFVMFFQPARASFPSRSKPRVLDLEKSSSYGTKTGSDLGLAIGIERRMYPFRTPIESGVLHVMDAPGSTSFVPIRTKWMDSFGTDGVLDILCPNTGFRFRKHSNLPEGWRQFA